MIDLNISVADNETPRVEPPALPKTAGTFGKHESDSQHSRSFPTTDYERLVPCGKVGVQLLAATHLKSSLETATGELLEPSIPSRE
jgi:hypothetical protein